MELERLNKALSTYEVAEHIYKVDDGKTLSEALSLLESANAQNHENMNDDDADPLSLKQALKHRAAPTGTRSPTDGKMIQLGVNHTKTLFHGHPVRNNPTKSRAEDQLDNHRGAELPWISKKGNNVSKVQLIKNACAKARLAKESENPYQLNAVMENFLRKKAAETRALEEGTLTPAQRSISAHPSAAGGSYKVPSRVPSEFDSAAQRAADTKARMPAEFKPKIEATKDRSFGAMAARTKAASTIERPVASKDGIINPETDSQGEIADEYWPHPKAAVIKQAKDKTNPKTREGQWPANPADPVSPEETASSRSPGSRW
jgi:hypothetical protein